MKSPSAPVACLCMFLLFASVVCCALVTEKYLDEGDPYTPVIHLSDGTLIDTEEITHIVSAGPQVNADRIVFFTNGLNIEVAYADYLTICNTIR